MVGVQKRMEKLPMHYCTEEHYILIMIFQLLILDCDKNTEIKEELKIKIYFIFYLL